jgi:prefoldin subunit 5
MPIVSILIVLFFGGGISYFAESSLPDEFLYPIKIYVNENAEEAISVTDGMKADFEIQSASRRLAEIEKLAEKNKLTEKILENSRTHFSENLTRFKKISLKMEEKGKGDVSSVRSDMQSSLEAHRELLLKIQKEKKPLFAEFGEFIHYFNEELANISESRRSSEERVLEGEGVDVKSDTEESLAVLERKIEETAKILNEEKKKRRGSVLAAEEKLKEAIAHLAEGKAKLEIPAYADAFALFKRAEREAVSARTLIDF